MHTRAACFSQSMFLSKTYCFSVKLISHFSRPARSHNFGVRLMVLNQISRSHGKSQNLEDKLTFWMVFFLSSRWMMFQCFGKQKQPKLIFSHLKGTDWKSWIDVWLPLTTIPCIGCWFLSLIFRIVSITKK